MATNDEIRAKDVVPELTDFRDDSDGLFGDGNQSSFFMKALNLLKSILGRIHLLPTSITSFRAGDVLPVDGPNGPAKMSKDDLLKETAQNTLDKSIAKKFLTTELYSYYDVVSYNGALYICQNDHPAGPWVASDFVKISCDDLFLAFKMIQGISYELNVPTGISRFYLPYIKGITYRITNTGSASIRQMYIMRKASTSYDDVVRSWDYVNPGATVQYTCDDSDFLFIQFNNLNLSGTSFKVTSLQTLSSVVEDVKTKFGITPFSEDVDYKYFDLVSHNGVVYQCQNDHPAGPWVASDFASITIDDIYSFFKAFRYLPVLIDKKANVNTYYLPYIAGATYEITNVGEYTVADSYIMRKATTSSSDVVRPFGPIAPGKTVTYQSENDVNFSFLNLIGNIATQIQIKITKNDGSAKFPLFSEDVDYKYFDLVSYNGDIYQCQNDHPAGPWVASDFVKFQANNLLLSSNFMNGIPYTLAVPTMLSRFYLPYINGITYEIKNNGNFRVNASFIMRKATSDYSDVVATLGSFEPGQTRTYTCDDNKFLFIQFDSRNGVNEFVITATPTIKDFNDKINSLPVVTSNDLYMCLPSKIYMVKGLPYNIYGDSVNTKELIDVDFFTEPRTTSNFESDLNQVGKVCKLNNLKDCSIRVGFADFVNRKNRLIYKDIDVVWKDNPSGVTKNCVVIGDSITNRGSGYFAKLAAQSVGAIINGYGTMSNYGSFNGEGREGWTWANFIGKSNLCGAGTITPMGSGSSGTLRKNPFIRLATDDDKLNYPDYCFTSTGVKNESSYTDDPSQSNYYIFDFTEYLNRFSGVAIDTVTIALGTNDINQNYTIEQITAYANFMISRIKSALPNAKIAVLPSPAWGYGNPNFKSKVVPMIEAVKTLSISLGVDVVGLWCFMSRCLSFGVKSSEITEVNASTNSAPYADSIHFDSDNGHVAYMEYGKVLASYILAQ